MDPYRLIKGQKLSSKGDSAICSQGILSIFKTNKLAGLKNGKNETVQRDTIAVKTAPA